MARLFYLAAQASSAQVALPLRRPMVFNRPPESQDAVVHMKVLRDPCEVIGEVGISLPSLSGSIVALSSASKECNREYSLGVC